MFTVSISQEQKRYAWQLVSKVNFGKRGTFDGDPERQYTGILGEVVMADSINAKRPNGVGGYDCGIDFKICGVGVDLKTMGRTTDVRNYYVNNLIASQVKQSKTDVYVFSSIHKGKPEMTICGLMSKRGLEKYFVPGGTERERSDGSCFRTEVDMYEIPNGDLKQVSSWLEVGWNLCEITGDRSRCL